MNNQIKTILQDLYEIDASFKKHEQELIKIINKILVSKPDTKFDQAFAKQLRAELLAKAKQLQVDHRSKTSLLNSLTELFTMRKLAYVAGGAVLTALILIPVLNSLNKQKVTPTFDLGLQIAKVGDQAFGTLTAEEQPVAEGRGAAPEAELGLGAGGFPSTAPEVKMVPRPDLVNYKYVYKGEPITINQDEMTVFKRLKGDKAASQLAGLLNTFNLGLADLSTFGQTQLQNMSFVQDKKYGYYINVNLFEGTISFSQNWQTWPQVRCLDQKCYEEQRVKFEDIPADEELIRIADKFIKDHKINMDTYGQPFIQEAWKIMYAQAENKEMVHLPQTISVIYPLIINSKNVYEQSGTEKIGLTVMVNVKEKRVSGLHNLNTQSYQSSLYPTETNIEKIMALTEKGGLNSWQYPGASKTIEVEIGNPTIELIRIWQYKDGQNSELFVPALLFPVLQAPAEISSYKKNVVVPLIKEILEEQKPVPVIRPMPEPIIVEEKSVQ